MYKERTSEDWKKDLLLGEDYKVDSLLLVGSGMPKKQYLELENTLNSFYPGYTQSKIEFEFFEKVRVIEIQGKRIWFDVVYGGAYMSELMHIGCMLGSKVNLFLGSVGGLQKGSKSGDIIVPTFSYGEESSTKLYSRDSINDTHFPNEELSKNIFSKISPKFNPRRGSLITCQAMLGETWEDIQNWSDQGYSGVEMETATFFSVSNHFDVPSSALLYISDNLIEKETMHSEGYENARERRNDARSHNYKLALETIINSKDGVN